jgi:hypothetical protein
MYVCISEQTCMCRFEEDRIYLYICVHVCMFVCMYEQISTWHFIEDKVYLHVCVCACMFVSMYACMNIYLCGTL